MKYIKTLVLIFILSTLSACGSKLLTVHKIDVQQGNALDAEMVSKLQLGMTKEQVQYVLGSPLINDAFHPERWDYIFLYTPGYGEQERRQLTVIFDRDEVIEIAKDNIVEGDTAGIDRSEEDSVAEEKLSAREKKQLEEQEQLEKQAGELEDALETNKNPNN